MALLVIVVLLLVVMPVLLYLMARGVKAYTVRRPKWLDFPSPRTSEDQRRIEALKRDKS
jgi:nitric oxide reductase large subunit